MQRNDVANGGNDVFDRQDLRVKRRVGSDLLVDLVTTNSSKVIALLVEEVVLQEVARSLARWWLARTKFAIDI